MRRIIATITALVLLAISLLVPAPAFAATNPFQGVCQNGGAGTAVCTNNTTDPIAGPNGALIKVTSILAAVTGIISVIFLVIGGMKYVTSGGDSSGVATAKSTIIYALVGMVIALLARPIVSFVITRV